MSFSDSLGCFSCGGKGCKKCRPFFFNVMSFDSDEKYGHAFARVYQDGFDEGQKVAKDKKFTSMKTWEEKIRNDYEGIVSDEQIEATIDYWRDIITEAEKRGEERERERNICVIDGLLELSYPRNKSLKLLLKERINNL